MNSPGASAVRQILILFAATAALGTASQFLHSHRIPWRQDWSHHVEEATRELGVPVATLEDARRIVSAGTHILLDARPPADYAAGHIAAAFSVPSEEMDKYLPSVMPLLTREQPIMTYCSGHQCDESLKLSKHLIANGFTNVVLFVGGFTEWTAAQLPVEK